MSRLDDRCLANDSVMKLVSEATMKTAQNDDLAKSLNTLRTVPGAPNPFVVNPRRASSSTPSSPSTPALRGTSNDRQG